MKEARTWQRTAHTARAQLERIDQGLTTLQARVGTPAAAAELRPAQQALAQSRYRLELALLTDDWGFLVEALTALTRSAALLEAIRADRPR
jgi:hypothetical protein